MLIGARRELDRLNTVVGELRINLTTMQPQLTDLASRVRALETTAATESASLLSFQGHVQSCEKSNERQQRERDNFRKEMRGYGLTIVTMILAGIGYLLVHGLPYAVVKP